MNRYSDTTLSSIANGLQKIKWHGDYKFTACCPAHDDHNPSFSATNVGGRILVKCFAGCSQEEVIGALRDLGLWHNASRLQIERRKRLDLKREFRRHQGIVACGIGTIKYGVVLSEINQVELIKSIKYLEEYANG